MTFLTEPEDADVLARYAQQRSSLFEPETGRRDEMVDDGGRMRPAWREVGTALKHLGRSGLLDRSSTVARLLSDDGVTYRAYGSTVDQPWALDPVPFLLDEAEWAALEPAMVQRTELLDLILTDLYGPRTLVSRGLLPPEVVFGHAGFVREVDQLRLPGPRQLLLSSADVARSGAGHWQVLADRAQAPSGAGYAMANRRIVARAMPGLYRGTGIRRVGPFFDAMRLALQQVSPHVQEAPRVVLLTSGSRSETAFDQAFLSSLLGFPLVEGADLVVQDGRVWQRSIGRLEPVDVIVRRVDSWFCDPLELRPDSQLGSAGLVEAVRLGTVAVVNGLGTGVLENPGLFPFLPGIARALLDQDLALPSVPTWWCGDDAGRAHVLANLGRLVVKPISRGVSQSSRFGWELSGSKLADLRRRIAARPWAWVGQEPLALSTAPTVAATGLEPRAVVLRTFAVAHGGTYRMMAGGLTRVASTTDSLVVSNQKGGVSKDVWVLTAQSAVADDLGRPEHLPLEPVHAVISPRVAEDMFWLGRYVERAEDVARLLRVTDNRWRDVRPDSDAALARCLIVLLEALTAVTTTWPGFLGPGSQAQMSDPRAELVSLLVDDGRVGTLAHDLRRARELANSVRDQLSNDTWLVLSGLDRGLVGLDAGDRRDWDVLDVNAVLSRLLEALLAFAGLAAESMVRDAGWLFMDAGRRIERALQLTGLLAACFAEAQPPLVEDFVVESAMIAAESIITHRRRYPAGAGVDTVLDLLLTDGGNPRSLTYQLGRLANDLERLPAGAGHHASGIGDRLLDLIALVRAAEPAALAEVRDGSRTILRELLGTVGSELSALGMAIEDEHFAQPAPVQTFDAMIA